MLKKEDVKVGTMVMWNPLIKVGEYVPYGDNTDPKNTASSLAVGKDMPFTGKRKITSQYDKGTLWNVVRLSGGYNSYYSTNMFIDEKDYVSVDPT